MIVVGVDGVVADGLVGVGGVVNGVVGSDGG